VNIFETSASSQSTSRWLYISVLAYFLMAGLLLFSLETGWVRGLELRWRLIYEVLVVLLLSLPVGWMVLQVRRFASLESKAHRRLKETENLVADAYQRLAAVFRIREQFAAAESEKEIIELLLRNTVDLSGAAGASFVPLDEHRQPLPPISYGQPKVLMPEAWLEYLASPAIRSRCGGCEKHNRFVSTCPLLQGPFADMAGIYCIPLRQGEREFGVLNLYIPDSARLNVETQAFLGSLVDETAHALEAVWLRQRELDALAQIQAVRQKGDLYALLSGLLDNVYQILEPDFALLVLKESASAEDSGSEITWRLRDNLLCGSLPPKTQPFIKSTIQRVLTTDEGISFSSGAGQNPPGLASLQAVPLISNQSPIGALLVGYKRPQTLNQRQLALLQTVAGQIALVVQNANHLAEIEYKAILGERTRLAREIHDGLAQTLGFLKLQAAQMQAYLERGEMDRLKQGIRLYYQTLSEAYHDARNAIDGLRISGSRLEEWLQQVVEEFQDNVDVQPLSVNVQCSYGQNQLPPEVQAQLIRIVQEALSNIRKHARAKNVYVACFEKNGDLLVEIQDDGQGFSAADVPRPSQHGLRGMRERAELIRADFQVISLPQQGTTIRISVPIKVEEISL
jgi:two-component system, NarL family, nitrate/nitrite sensor histidine kinase NarX